MQVTQSGEGVGSHGAPLRPPSRHRVPFRVGHVMVPHAPAAQLTLHEHAFGQLIPSHAPVPVQLTVHAAPVPQVTPSHAPDALQVKVHTPALHWTLLHAFITEQLTAHDAAVAGQSTPPHVLEPRQAMSHA